MMKRLVLAMLATVMSLGALTVGAQAGQVGPGNAAADLNGDGEVTLSEVKRYNRGQRRA
ncbi:MAG: hypothetical protein ACFBSG_16065 [Leptolyngbyaceae cyanobacterium]